MIDFWTNIIYIFFLSLKGFFFLHRTKQNSDKEIHFVVVVKINPNMKLSGGSKPFIYFKRDKKIRFSILMDRFSILMDRFLKGVILSKGK